MSLASGAVQIVRHQIPSVVHLLFSWFQDERVCGLDVVVDDVVWQDTTLPLWKEEEWDLLDLRATHIILWIVWVVDVEDTSGES